MRTHRVVTVKTGNRVRRAARLLATGAVLVLAAFAAAAIWQYYVAAPWTRNGSVRVQVANIAPQVSGQIVELRVADNQFVHKGDVLYVIEPFDFKIAVNTARAQVEYRAADLKVKQAQDVRRRELTTLSTSVEEKQTYAGTAAIAEANYSGARSQLAQAEMNLWRTSVRSTVNGYVTNLLLRVGDYATAGSANISVVDSDSYWIDGYFEETKMAHIHVGDAAEATLMGYPAPIRGRVESITRGIATGDAAPSTQGLPNVDPVYTWVRLAQRVPVRIQIEQIPEGVRLVAGMTATIRIADPATRNQDCLHAALIGLGTAIYGLTGRRILD
jgi:multidrug resistance efflux pump